MGPFFFLLILFGIDLYFFLAMRGAFFAKAGIPGIVLSVVYFLITAFAFGWILGIWKVKGDFAIYIRAVIFILYLSKLAFLIPILIDDIRRLVVYALNQFSGEFNFDASRSRFMKHFALGLSAIPFTSLLYGMIRNPYRYKIFSEEIQLDNIPDSLKGLRIIQISDLHAGSFTFKEPVENAITMINELKPDIVFFTGDLVNYKAEEMEPFVHMFEKIRAKYGVYSILGNHDYGDYYRWESVDQKRENFKAICELHGRMGWNLLRNENVQLNILDKKVSIAGVENYSALPQFPKHGDLDLASQGTENSDLRILLSHDPTHWDEQVTKSFKNIHLTFSGHTHGFQFGIEVPGFLRWSPSKYIYNRWAGLYKSGNQYLYVNRGLGFLGYPGRVGILPEITSIKLV